MLDASLPACDADPHTLDFGAPYYGSVPKEIGNHPND
jgi:hypothetical protein